MSTRFVRLFKPQFAPLVKARTKRQTVRPTPARLPRPGDIVDCREWSGKPYRSKQNKIGEWPLLNVSPCVVSESGVKIRGRSVIGLGLSQFAEADGFTSWPAMRDWFRNTHGLPFSGILLEW